MKKTLEIPDIRNKLGPITSLISFLEDGNYKWALRELEQCKKSVNYLADRNVFDLSNVPEFVSLNGSALRYDRDENEYWRDAGAWRVGYKEKDGVFYSVSDMGWLDNVELKPITREEWKKDNKGWT